MISSERSFAGIILISAISSLPFTTHHTEKNRFYLSPMPPKYPRLLVSEPTKADKGSNLRDPLYNSLFDLSALRLGYEIFAQQFVQKISAQVEFIPDDRFVIHFLFLHTLILNVQFSILFVNSTEICTLFSVQTVAALCHHRAVTLYFNSGSLRLFACKNCRICPAPPTSGIFQTAAGTASWDSHPGMVLMPPSPLLLTVAGRKYHYPLVQVIAHLLPRKF